MKSLLLRNLRKSTQPVKCKFWLSHMHYRSSISEQDDEFFKELDSEIITAKEGQHKEISASKVMIDKQISAVPQENKSDFSLQIHSKIIIRASDLESNLIQAGIIKPQPKTVKKKQKAKAVESPVKYRSKGREKRYVSRLEKRPIIKLQK